MVPTLKKHYINEKAMTLYNTRFCISMKKQWRLYIVSDKHHLELCYLNSDMSFLTLSYQYHIPLAEKSQLIFGIIASSGIRTWKLRRANYQLRDITQRLRLLGHHGGLAMALYNTNF